MSRRKMPGLYKRIRTDGSFEWKIDKRVPRYGRVCEGTGTSDYDEAERHLARKLEEIRAATVYGVRPPGMGATRAGTRYPDDQA